MATILNIDEIQTVKNNLHRDLLMTASCQTKAALDAIHAESITNVEDLDSVLVFERRRGQARKYVPGHVKKAVTVGGVWENQAKIAVSSVIYPVFLNNFRAKEGFSILGSNGEYDPKGIDAVEAALMQIAESHSNQNYLNLVHGVESDEDNETALFDGWNTHITKLTAEGRISAAKGNLMTGLDLSINLATATSEELKLFYKKVVNWYTKLPVLLRAQKFDAHCTVEFFTALTMAYAATYQSVNPEIVNAPGFTFPNMPNAYFIPNDIWGTGNKLMATVEKNLQVISDIDSTDASRIASSAIDLWKDNDDSKIVKIQVFTGMATRIKQISSDKFCVTDGTWTPITNLGGNEYQLTEEEQADEEAANIDYAAEIKALKDEIAALKG